MGSGIPMVKRKNRSQPRFIKRRCVEYEDSSWFLFMMILLIATITFWVYVTISICKIV